MRKTTTGFTIVELLIVIVVIGILAAISLVAYSGVQSRARDSSRTSAVRQIQRGLELYRHANGVYPAHIAAGSNLPAGFTGRWGTSYSYSVATDDSWLRNLTSAGTIPTAPVDPVNDTSHYFTYWSSASYGKCTKPFYVLSVIGYENDASIPDDSKGLVCTWGGQTANWGLSAGQAIFSNITTPPDPS